MLKQNKGVTLVALVITIIVLLILAGVTLAMVMGDSGIFTKANKASAETNVSSAKDAIRLALLEVTTANYNDNGQQIETLTAASALEKVNAQLDSVGEGYKITSGTVTKSGTAVKTTAGNDLTATFNETSNGAITVTFGE